MSHIIINNNRFETFVFDSVDSIKERIAVTLFNAVPVKFLAFTPNIISTTQHDINFIVENMASFFTKQGLTFPIHVYERFKDAMTREDAERIFISTNLTLEKSLETDERVTSTLLSSMKGLETITHPEDVWRSREKFRSDNQLARAELSEKVASHTRMAEEFQSIPAVRYSPLEPAHIQFSIVFKPSNNITINDLFNRMKLTKFVPYINFGTLFKIKYGFVVNPEWLELEAEGVIILKASSEIDAEMRGLKDEYRKYTSVAFAVLQNGANSQIVATVDLSIGARNVDKAELTSRVLECASIPRSEIERIEDTAWTGYYSIRDQTLLIPVWTELSMNNAYFNSIVAVDEFVRASKTKQNVYTHFTGSKDTASIAMQSNERNKFFVRVRVKSYSKAAAGVCQEVLGRFFTLYNNEKDRVLHEYREYIGDFMRDEERKIAHVSKADGGERLKSIAPDLFIPSYSRKCLNRPTIISDALADEYEQTKQHEIMRYPIFGEGTTRNYICEHDTHPFPGLRNNDLENKVQYPYLPCCYTKDQKTKAGSKYMKYFDKLSVGRKKTVCKQRPDLFFTDKILDSNMPGVLPTKIKRLFSLIQADVNYCFVRIGSRNSPTSALEAVLRGLNKSTDPDNVRRTFDRITTTEYAMAAKQELFNDDVETIIKYMHDNIKPQVFVHAIEELFNVDIFLFSADSMLIPPHAANLYAKSVPTRKVLLLYQHKRDEDAGHNQCEIIARVKTADEKHLDREYLFTPGDPAVGELWSVFERMTRAVSLRDRAPVRQIQFARRPTVKSQSVDMNGKCRLLNVEFANTTVSFACDPIAPFAAPPATGINRIARRDVIEQFAHTFGIQLVDQIHAHGSVREVDAVMCGTHKITFLVDMKQELPIPINRDREPRYMHLFNEEEDIVGTFRRRGKLAKMVYQYALFVLSMYLFDNGKQGPLDDAELVQFMKTRTVVIPGYEYDGAVFSTFRRSSQFISNNKLVLSSYEMLKRILFMIRLYQHTHFQTLLDYRLKTNVDDYFESISDYDHVPNGVLVDGEETVRTLMTQITQRHCITDHVTEGTAPYFFQNSVLDNTLYLARNFKTLEEATAGSRNIAVYRFASATDIQLLLGDPRVGKILGWKVDNEAVYTTLTEI
jgi:hypothetical protein